MNELETVYWSLTNNILGLAEIETGMALDYLMITALFAKKLNCDEAENKIHEAFLSHNYPTFMRNYMIWESMRSIKREDYDMAEVNQEFRMLFGDSDGVNQQAADLQEDYNFIVDSLEDEHVRRLVHTTKTNDES